MPRGGSGANTPPLAASPTRSEVNSKCDLLTTCWSYADGVGNLLNLSPNLRPTKRKLALQDKRKLALQEKNASSRCKTNVSSHCSCSTQYFVLSRGDSQPSPHSYGIYLKCCIISQQINMTRRPNQRYTQTVAGIQSRSSKL